MRTKKQTLKPDMIILGYLSRYGSISRQTAASLFGVWDLHNVIYRLRKKNHEIDCEGVGKNLKYTIPKQAEKYKSKPRDKEIVHTS